MFITNFQHGIPTRRQVMLVRTLHAVTYLLVFMKSSHVAKVLAYWIALLYPMSTDRLKVNCIRRLLKATLELDVCGAILEHLASLRSQLVRFLFNLFIFTFSKFLPLCATLMSPSIARQIRRVKLAVLFRRNSLP